MPFPKPIMELVRQRYSCRTFDGQPIETELRRQLTDFMESRRQGPLGTALRFELIAATAEDSSALRGLGTYGFIKGASGFIVGAVQYGDKDMEEFGYRMEEIILFATGLGLGTCWLGGTFRKSRFADEIQLRPEERLPAVTPVGYAADKRRLLEQVMRQAIRADKRKAWAELFFEREFGRPLSQERAGAYAWPLEMVRLGPSASNRQPWRIVHQGEGWHFYLQRTPGYARRLQGYPPMDDLQRVDMGIAMAHFELTAREQDLPGGWRLQEPPLGPPDRWTEYVISWVVG